jgi:hypothetical protein
MKHTIALRHLYTDGCTRLECMPPELGQITSLRTITWFVVGSGLSCSSLAELKNLNIGGSLILKKLENVPGRRNAKAASLVELRLSNCSKAEQLPPLCQLAELQLLHLKRLGNFWFLCSSCTSSKFGKLEDLDIVYNSHFIIVSL